MSPRSQRAKKSSRTAIKAGATTPPSSPESPSPKRLSAKKKSLSLRNPGPVVVVNVEDSDHVKKCYIIHKAVICHHSRYFNAAFNGTWIESQTFTSNFQTISCEAFGIFNHWLYHQNLGCGEDEVLSFKDLLNVWILADSIDCFALMNDCIEALNDKFGQMDELPTKLFPLVYNSTADNSPLRRVLVDMCVGHIGKIELNDEFPREMLVDILKASAEIKSTKVTKFSKDKIQRYFVDEELPGRH